MHESESENPDTAASEVGPSRAEYVEYVLRTARENLARSRGDEQFRDAEPLGVPEWRSRGRPLAPRDRTPAAPASAPQPDAQVPSWEQDRGAVLEAIVGLRELCEALDDRMNELQKEESKEPLELPSLRSLRR